MFIQSLFVKLLSKILKLLGKGSGTALPGLIVEKFFPSIVQNLVKDIPNRIVITGTNGKTTTQSMLKSILIQAGKKVVTNSAGANLKRGIISALLKNTNIWGKLDTEYLIIEVEEGTMPQIVEDINPTIIAVTNLYRDQLDAYGEVDVTERYIRKAIELSPNSELILNIDDPRVSQLADGLTNKTHYISIPKEFSYILPYEGNPCDIEAPNTLKAEDISINENLSVEFHVKNQNGVINEYSIKTPGFFHVYNALIAIKISQLLGIDEEKIKTGLKEFNPAFGRGEEILSLDKNHIFKILLVKNPAGMNLNLDLLKNSKNLKLVLLLNDNIADGTDVSWIWDAKFEILNDMDIDKIYLGGKRARDLGVRIKYALNKDIFEKIKFEIEESIESIIDKVKFDSKKNEIIFVLPTYTAMLELRRLLGRSLE